MYSSMERILEIKVHFGWLMAQVELELYRASCNEISKVNTSTSLFNQSQSHLLNYAYYLNYSNQENGVSM